MEREGTGHQKSSKEGICRRMGEEGEGNEGKRARNCKENEGARKEGA